MPKPWYSIKAAAQGSDVAEVSVLDAISPWYEANARTFLAQVRALKEAKVKLFINSPGGSVIEALTMFNGLRATGKSIEVHVLGIAASAASYLAMAGDKVVMPRNTMMLLHKPMVGEHGNADDHRAAADTLDKLESLLTPAYMRRFKGSEEELQALLREDDILTAEQCLEHGFCDEVVDEIEATAEFDVEMLPPEARKVFEAASMRAASAAPKADPAAEKPLADQIAEYAQQKGLEGYSAVFVTDPVAVSLEAARKMIDDAAGIVALARHANLADRAEALIRGRKTLAEARVALSEALADADASTSVRTTPSSKSAQGGNDPAKGYSPSALWDEIKSMKR
jgi:ATP-dependent Clp protease, protease subunit